LIQTPNFKMKFVLAILVLLVLFTEGNGNRDVRRAHQKNHKLKMKQLRKTAALPQDEPAPSPMPPVSFKFPVEVDLTEVKSMLERRFAVIDTIQNQLAAIAAEVTANYDRIAFVESKATTNENEIESVRSSLGNLTSKGMSFCQTGMTGCSSCGGKDEDDAGGADTVTPVSYEVTFPKEFPGTPDVTSALNEIYQTAPGKGDGYGWRITANDVTSSSFTLLIELIDRDISKFYANWIACYTL